MRRAGWAGGQVSWVLGLCSGSGSSTAQKTWSLVVSAETTPHGAPVGWRALSLPCAPELLSVSCPWGAHFLPPMQWPGTLTDRSSAVAGKQDLESGPSTGMWRPSEDGRPKAWPSPPTGCWLLAAGCRGPHGWSLKMLVLPRGAGGWVAKDRCWDSRQSRGNGAALTAAPHGRPWLH